MWQPLGGKILVILTFIFISFILSKFGGHSILKIHGPVMLLNTCLFPFSFLIPVILESTYLSICPPFLNFFFHIMSSWRVENLMELSFISRLSLWTYQPFSSGPIGSQSIHECFSCVCYWIAGHIFQLGKTMFLNHIFNAKEN